MNELAHSIIEPFDSKRLYIYPLFLLMKQNVNSKLGKDSPIKEASSEVGVTLTVLYFLSPRLNMIEQERRDRELAMRLSQVRCWSFVLKLYSFYEEC